MTSDDVRCHLFENQHFIQNILIHLKCQSDSLTSKDDVWHKKRHERETQTNQENPKAKDEALPVEQITELMLVHNKNDPKAACGRSAESTDKER